MALDPEYEVPDAAVRSDPLQSHDRGDATVEKALHGRRILLIEDDYFLAFELRSELVRQGANVVGPFGTVDLALDLARSARRIDAAVIDVDLHGEFVFPVTDELIKRDVPVVYWTGHDAHVLPYRHRHIDRYVKPVSAAVIARGVAELLAGKALRSNKD